MIIYIINITRIIIMTFLWIIIYDALLMSIPILQLKSKHKNLDKFYIDKQNNINFQEGNKCAAFASAYILRFFNISADGNSLYKNFPCKLPSGDITPLGIRILFKKYGFKTKYYKGNMNSLKAELDKGIPVIVFIHSNAESKVRHFVPVTGYDQEGFYLAESLSKLTNISDEKGIYNRKVCFDDFKKMWNIRTIYMPFYSYTYISVVQNRISNL